MKYSLAGILNESAVCLVEGNSSLEDLDEAETRYKAAYNLYLKSAGKLKAENEVANLSECYRERAQYFNKEGSFSSFIESLHIARYYLELGYKMREDVSALDENYKSIYHRYLFQQNIAWMNLKNPEIILTMEFDKSKIDAYIKKEISSIEIDDKIKKESPIKTWIDEKNNPERTTKIFYEFLLSDSQEHLDNVVKYVLDGSLDTKRKIDELMNELMGRKINELMEAVEIKYNLVQLLRYYGIYYKKRLQYSVENEIDNKSENFRKAECLLKRSIECGKHMDDEKACKRACKLAYRELAVLYIMMSMKEEVKETLEEMAYIFTELDPKKGFGKWYVEKIREYKLPIEMKFS